ncbi:MULTISPECIES: galactitol-1-phosphate 5-dehydrogenase [Aerococcus]|uniref:galactitol-1-phosphate 5-dehydrogenase n=1 Tax=Aerococcus TaxID=1375 RepID=UPI000DCCC027|nr:MULTISPECIES: galactitol-1-phosphate 5-dehydrogenase [Aerococcus]MCY3034575.1 galactitol-1-phosphate 5-dehydrogenase [Aerococcus mictus]MCY3036285.1 galactitol-1-phosphate 5-dehydrogenase [Aerococcus sp. Group 2]MCY3072856.1 galactitol-1-phosphate 5-dehydrogenase [Aerococcus mictus]MDK6375264.1 galactitol-1-phosphate 5-dehydrogenase [Aerococcus urinae]MDK6420112.1 galactitol-1-phosphate 5-dehydrogenase [Aerococcus urinae]
MKATQLNENQEFEYVEIDEPECQPGWVKVKVHATGVCGSDTHKIEFGWKYDLPAVMGHEIAGEVVEVGEGVTRVKVGERVIVPPLIPDFSCQYCEQGLYGLCENYKMIGTHYIGGFAEKLVAPETNILPIGDMDYEDAVLIEPFAVSMHSVMNMDVELGDTAVVLGIGAIGIFTIEALLLAGCKNVIAVDINDDKLEVAKQYGASYGINSIKEDLEAKVKEYTNGLGADIVMECAGTPITQEQALVLAKKRGKVGYTGIGYRDVLLHERHFESIFRHELTLKGFWNSYSAPFPGKEWTNLIAYINQGRVNLEGMITHRYPLNKVDEAFKMMLSREETFNKVIILPQEEKN